MKQLMTALFVLSLSACATSEDVGAKETEGTIAAAPLEAGQAEAVFAGGCFWCIEKDFEKVEGVLTVESGYTGGRELNPTYQQVGYHLTSHYEAIRVVYDPEKVTYEALLTYFWHHVDPTDAKGQFCDKGDQYRTGIFTSDPDEMALAATSRAAAQEQLGQPIVTEILPAATFWVAEEYHQDFYKKNPVHYTAYRTGCGRDARVEELWGDVADH
jgi:peptide-methionine (S)-S-oxide reductase